MWKNALMAYEICHLVISFMLFSDISRSFVSCAPSVFSLAHALLTMFA